MLKLVKPDIKYKSQIEEVIEEVKKDSDPFGTGKWYLNLDINKFEDFVQKKLDESKGKGLPEGYVASSTFFAVDEKDRYVGCIILRHDLTENLIQSGGHISYDVRPSERKKGYCSEMLKLCLEEAKNSELRKFF